MTGSELRKLKFDSLEHQQRFENVLEVSKVRSDYYYDDDSYQAMIYVLTSDSLVKIYDDLTDDTIDSFSFILDSPVLEESFLAKYGLSHYFDDIFGLNPIEVKDWFDKAEPKIQSMMLISESISR